MLQEGALAGLTVVELSGQAAGSFCARLLGDAGVDVVKVEHPEGDRYPQNGPYPGDALDSERWSASPLCFLERSRAWSVT